MLKRWMARAVLGRTAVGATLDPDDRPDAAFEARWRSAMKSRLLLALGLIGIWAVGLEARLIFLQVVSHEEYASRARQQQQDVFEPEPARGDILDRNGEVLAYSVESHRVIAYPSRSKDPVKDAAEICAALGDCTAAERSKLAADLKGDGKYHVVRKPRLVSPTASIRLQALITARKDAGLPEVVSLNPESRRYYPKFTLASHILGFVGDERQGAEGIEARYEKVIAGEKGRVYVQVDGRRASREISTRVERAPTAGANLELTIDLRLQHIAERELAAAVRAHGAAGGSVVMMDPFTGEILAQASFPTFNPNLYWEEAPEKRRNRVVTDTYEPGSTFKIVTAAAALNEGFYQTTDLIDTAPGVIKLPGRKPIDEAHGRNYGVLSFEDVLIKSSNVGAIKIGQRIGSERLMRYVRGFGFGQTLAPDFASQSRGQVAGSGHLSDSTLASMSMGYEIGVTPLQVAAAASVIANGGSLIEPRILRSVTRDGRREMTETKVLRRVISPETALTMTALMEGVAERGTAKGAALDRFRVAGKTGTASKVINGRYSLTDYNVSFVGFVPSRQPALTILVVIDTPRKGPAYGGTIAAPVFKRIAEAALQQMGASPSVNPVPPIVTMTQGTLPPAPRKSLPAITQVGGRPVMPDIRGLTLRDAVRVANALGLTLTTEGDGVVVTQFPGPGEFVEPGGTGLLRLRRHPVVDGSGK